jgi:large subunit ribosomal protein L10
MSNQQIVEAKTRKVDQIKEKIAAASLMVVTDYSGMTVKQISELRRKLDQHKAEYKVFKNTMMGRALPENFADLKLQLNGPVAILFGYEDVVLPLKILVKFAEDTKKPKVLSGVVEGIYYGKEKILALSALPGREELLAKIVGGLKSPLYGLVNVLSGNLRKLVYALEAVKQKKSQGGES